MEGSHLCSNCEARLEPDDGHDLCPGCLGAQHLREALSDDACMNCNYMSHAVRVSRLAAVEGEGGLPPSGQLPQHAKRAKRRGEAPTRQTRHSRSRTGAVADDAVPPAKKTKPESRLTSKVDQLATELAEMRAMFMGRQPEFWSEEASTPSMPCLPLEPEHDTLSLAASATHFREYEEEQEGSISRTSDHSSGLGSLPVSEDGSMRAIMRMALERLNMAVPEQAEATPASAFFRRRPLPTAFSVPHSGDFIRELQSSWADTRAGARLSADARTLAAMHDAAAVGLDHMPAIEPCIASLIVSPDESLRRDTRCPRPQCRLTDDLLIRAYDTGARTGRIANSLSHLMLALSASLPEVSTEEQDNVAGNNIALCDAALEAFGHMSRELGRMMSYIVQARRQVWLSQSSLTEASRRTLRGLPVEPGTVFGSAAQEALDRTIQADQTRQQLASLRRMPPPNRPPPRRGRVPPAASRPSIPPPARAGGQRRSQRPTQEQTRNVRVSDPTPPRPSRQFRAPDPGRPPARAPRGRGARY